MSDMIGHTVSHYKIIEKLGAGGMGQVYKAKDTKLDRFVALKFLTSDLIQDPEAKERFIHEAKAASALDHPNICGIHAIEEFEGQQFIDMEFVEGRTIGALLKDKELSLKSVLEIAIQIGEGLNAAHKKGVVHRDLKPDNIMLTAEGVVKITDFGLAKLIGASKLTKSHSTLGTFFYMSPEQAQGTEIDHRSDIFSSGAVLYEMVTGRRPFRGEHEAAIIYSLLNDTLEPLARYKANVPYELQRVVDKALTKDKSLRYQHVDEMTADLRRVQQEESRNVATVAKKPKAAWIVAACALLVAIVGVYLFIPRAAPVSAKNKSIAVLPFKNLSDNKEDEYFSDGITDDIIAQLSKIIDLKVISRTSVMQYKGISKNVREIGKELDVGTVLEGSVRRSGNQVRIVAQLIDAQNEGHLWSDTYDKEMTHIFAIQSDVAQRIAAELKAKLSSEEKERIEKRQTEDTEAYQLYLKGRFYWNKRKMVDLRKAIDYFNQAIEKDPNYSLAYAGLASTYVLLPDASGLSKVECMSRAETAVKKALNLDSALSEAHAALGSIKEFRDDWSGAEIEYKKAIELNPSYPTAHHWYSIVLNYLDRSDEAIAQAMRAKELDPVSLIINLNAAMQMYNIRQYDKAVYQLKKTMELDPNFPWTYSGLGWVYEAEGKYEEAIAEHEKAKSLEEKNPDVLADLGRAYARAGRKSEAQKILNDLLEFQKRGYVVSGSIANVYYGLGDKDKTFEWLEKACQDKSIYPGIKTDPIWDSIRSDPRFRALLKKIGLEK